MRIHVHSKKHFSARTSARRVRTLVEVVFHERGEPSNYIYRSSATCSLRAVRHVAIRFLWKRYVVYPLYDSLHHPPELIPFSLS